MWCDTTGDEAVADQIVDEVMSRIRPLLGLDSAMPEAVDVDAVRVAAGNVARRLTRDHDRRTCAQLLDVLWTNDRDGPPPGAWWSTPLGDALRAIRMGDPIEARRTA